MVYSPLKAYRWFCPAVLDCCSPCCHRQRRGCQLPLLSFKVLVCFIASLSLSFEFYTKMSSGALGEYTFYYCCWTSTCLVQSKCPDYTLLVVFMCSATNAQSSNLLGTSGKTIDWVFTLVRFTEALHSYYHSLDSFQFMSSYYNS